jgi:hypothetical protein
LHSAAPGRGVGGDDGGYNRRREPCDPEEFTMRIASKISPCLWFDDQAEEAARFYTSIFPDSRIVKISHYTEAGKEIHNRPPGSS